MARAKHPTNVVKGRQGFQRTTTGRDNTPQAPTLTVAAPKYGRNVAYSASAQRAMDRLLHAERATRPATSLFSRIARRLAQYSLERDTALNLRGQYQMAYVEFYGNTAGMPKNVINYKK